MEVEKDFPDMNGEISAVIEENTPEGVEVLEAMYLVVHWNGKPESKPRLTLGSCYESSDIGRVKALEKAIKMINS